ncbi:MAG: response regulator transcription factor [Chloroflexi bacterium]|nr:response regulator transcription factor [Chloroflexota bacterium]
MRVLLVDDHALFRAGLAGLLQASGLEVVGQAGDGDEAIASAGALHPDLIFMDINMPRRNGLEATRAIKADLPETRIVMLTVSDDERDLFEAIKSGAEGYLLKNMQEEEFEEFLRRLADGEPLISPVLARKLLQEFARLKDGEMREDAKENLSAREGEVLRLVATGATNREVADALVISENTAAFHMKNILTKLHLRNRAEVIRWAFDHGLLNAATRQKQPDSSDR